MTQTLTIAAASDLIRRKKLSPVELAKDCLGRIDRLNGRLNAFIRTTPERAMADARRSEERVMRGAARGRLDGIPIGHKDIFATAGIATTAHSRILEGNVPARDATVVARLADAGTVLLGKLATHEFALGGPSFDLPWPPARNPWNTDCFTGSSSSGTGAAVAAGLILGGTGTDTAGSIRHPATFCGISGIKPTYGRVSLAGITPLSFTLDHAGPIAWTAEDCAILLQHMAGHDPADPASADVTVEDFTHGLGDGVKGLRIGVLRSQFEDDVPASAHVRNAIGGALSVLRDMGAVISEVRLPPLQDYSACVWTILFADAFAIHQDWLRERYEDYGSLLRERILLGGLIGATDYIQALRLRRQLCMATDAAFETVDVLLTVGQSDEAPAIPDVARWFQLKVPMYTAPFNLTGHPAISVCIGFGPRGLPLGMQLVGRPFAERTLFRAAHAYEQATGWRDARPALAA